MVRPVNSNNKAQAEANDQYPVDFIEIVVSSSSTIRLCNFYRNLTWNSNTWSGNGNFLAFSGVSEDTQAKDNNITITLSGIDQSFLNTYLTNTIEGAKVTIYRGWVNTTTNALVADPDGRWGGFISSSTVTDDYNYTEEDSIAISIVCRSLVETILNRVSGRYTSESSFREFNSTDLSMEFVSSLTTKEFDFGKDK